MAEGGGEADLFRTAKIGVLWNMDLCPIPPAFSDVTQIAPQIKLALSILGYEGEVHIDAIGDTRKLKLNIIKDMRLTGIVLEHSDSDEYPNYTHVMAHIYGWPMRNRGTNILYISTDPSYVRDLDTLGRNGFNILRVQQKSTCGDAKQMWDWPDILNIVSQPLEANTLLNSNGRTDNNRDGKVRDVGPSSVEPNLLGDSGGGADNNRDGKVREVGPSSVEPNLLGDSGGGTDNNRDGKGRDVGSSLSKRSSVNSSGMADNNRDGMGEFGDYKGEQASGMADKNRDGMFEFGEQARVKPNADTSHASQLQSGRKRRKSYQLRSKFICS